MSLSRISVIPRSIGGLVFDAVFEEEHYLEMAVTDNPVESGVSVTDHAYMRPHKLRIQAGVTNTPLASKNDGYGSGELRTREAYRKLEELMVRREPFDVQTGLRLYKSMVCTSIVTDPQSASSSNSLVFTANLRSITIVDTQVVKYPPRKAGKAQNQGGKKKDQGEKQAEEVEDPKKRKSLAKKLFEAATGKEAEDVRSPHN